MITKLSTKFHSLKDQIRNRVGIVSNTENKSQLERVSNENENGVALYNQDDSSSSLGQAHSSGQTPERWHSQSSAAITRRKSRTKIKPIRNDTECQGQSEEANSAFAALKQIHRLPWQSADSKEKQSRYKRTEDHTEENTIGNAYDKETVPNTLQEAASKLQSHFIPRQALRLGQSSFETPQEYTIKGVKLKPWVTNTHQAGLTLNLSTIQAKNKSLRKPLVMNLSTGRVNDPSMLDGSKGQFSKLEDMNTNSPVCTSRKKSLSVAEMKSSSRTSTAREKSNVFENEPPFEDDQIPQSEQKAPEQQQFCQSEESIPSPVIVPKEKMPEWSAMDDKRRATVSPEKPMPSAIVLTNKGINQTVLEQSRRTTMPARIEANTWAQSHKRKKRPVSATFRTPPKLVQPKSRPKSATHAHENTEPSSRPQSAGRQHWRKESVGKVRKFTSPKAPVVVPARRYGPPLQNQKKKDGMEQFRYNKFSSVKRPESAQKQQVENLRLQVQVQLQLANERQSNQERMKGYEWSLLDWYDSWKGNNPHYGAQPKSRSAWKRQRFKEKLQKEQVRKQQYLDNKVKKVIRDAR